jgi:hypothetical protein
MRTSRPSAQVRPGLLLADEPHCFSHPTQHSSHHTRKPPGILVLLVIVWSMLGPRVAQGTRHLTEGSAACLLGLGTGLVLLAFSSSSGMAERLLEFNAGGFFT